MMRPPRTLTYLLATRIVLVAGFAVALLIAFFVIHYLSDAAELSQLTLEAEAASIAAAIADGQDPALWPMFRDHPEAYAFRAFEKGRRPGQRLLGQANVDLMPPLPPALPAGTDPVLRLRERFEALPMPDGRRGTSRWMITHRKTVDGRGIWVQMMMAGDPAWTWHTAVGNELLVHVAVPALVLVPMMTLSMLWVIHRALRPLQQIAREAAALADAAARSRTLTPLSKEGLTNELRAVVRAVNAMIAELDATLERERAFVSDAAHELRTPLAVLRLRVAELPPGPVSEGLDEELASLAHLVSQLLRFAQAEKVMASERRPVDLAAVVRQVCEDLALIAVRQQRELALATPALPVMVSGNATLLSVAVRNLIENALRAAPVGTAVAVTVDAGGVTVEDSGRGVPDEQKPLIFGRLWRADHRPEGAGIGLALVRRIMRLHDGDVSIEDATNGGTRFVLRLADAVRHESVVA